MSTRAERIRQLHCGDLGDKSTLVELACACRDAGIFPANIRRDTALAACRRALKANQSDGLPFAASFRVPKARRPRHAGELRPG